jgi:hypothetical protein
MGKRSIVKPFWKGLHAGCRQKRARRIFGKHILFGFSSSYMRSQYPDPLQFLSEYVAKVSAQDPCLIFTSSHIYSNMNRSIRHVAIWFLSMMTTGNGFWELAIGP